MSKSVTLIALALVVFLGLFVRVYALDTIPAGFFCDEASTGYNAYLLAQTGKDEFGTFLPVFFKSFNIYRPGVPYYISVPFVKLLGLNEFSTRLPAAFIGTISVIILFGLTWELTGSKTVSLLSALFVAISPWHIQFSRFGDENIYWPFFLSLSLYVFTRSLRKKKQPAFYGFMCTLWLNYLHLFSGLSARSPFSHRNPDNLPEGNRHI